MDVINSDKFVVVERALNRIYKEYDTILQLFGGDIHEYMANTAKPYNITIPMQNVISFVDNYYVDICEQVEKIFNNTQHLTNVSENFVKYYALLNEAIGSDNKTLKLAVVLILISKNVSNVSTKRIMLILKSMCVMPTVGMLVQASSNVLNEI